jgi:hypothetical protein
MVTPISKRAGLRPTRTSEATLPLGVDIRPTEIHFVLGRRDGLDLEVLRAGTIPISPPGPNATSEDRRREVEDGLAAYGITERRAIIALRETACRDVIHPDPHRIPQAEWHSSAAVYAREEFPVVAETDEIIARLAMDAERATIYAALASDIHEVKNRAESFGFRVVSIDAPQAAWLRIAPEGIVARNGPRDGYIVAPLAKAVHGQHVSPEPFPETESTTILTILNSFRTNRSFAGQRMSCNLPYDHIIYERSTETIMEPLVINGVTNPKWALALGLFLANEADRA